jgi:DNA-binding MarR family transcriptional regulator
MKCFCARTRHVARLLTRHYEEELRRVNVTPTQFELLGTISGRAGLSQSKIAEALSLDQTTLSRNLKVLIARKWVIRSASPEDSRRVVYTISEKGQAVFRQALPLWKRAQASIEQALGNEREVVWSTLDRLISVLQQEQRAG